MQPKAYSYIRFSSAAQADGDSIRRQTALTEAWCERNGVTLDKKLKLRDEGVSAFSGEHRDADNSDRFALAAFLESVKSGRVQKGSYLIVESLDRLSREEVGDAVEFFLGIVNRGIAVVQLTPVEIVYRRPVDTTQLIVAVVELSRSHSESAMKSLRIRDAWAAKRERAGA